MRPSPGSNRWYESAWRRIRDLTRESAASIWRGLRDIRVRGGAAPPPAPPFTTVTATQHDDLPAVFGKIDAAPEQRVALVIERPHGELRGTVPFARLRRHAQTRGKELAVVSRRGSVRSDARAARLPAVPSITKVRFGEPPRRAMFAVTAGRLAIEFRRPTARAAWTFGIAGLVFVLGSCSAYLVLPTADVTVYPHAEPFAQTLDFAASTQIDEIQLGGQPVLRMRELETSVNLRLAVPTTGTAVVGSEPARGEVQFSNLGDDPIVVAAGSVVRTENNVRFATSQGVTVDPDDEASVPVRAIEPGTEGNVEAGAIVALQDGPTELSVTNEEPFTGGEDEEVQAVADEDRENASVLAALLLEEDGVRRLQEEHDGEYLVVPSTVGHRTDSERFDQVPGDPATFLVLEVSGSASALAVSIDDLELLAGIAVALGYGPDMMPVEDSLVASIEGEPDFDAESGTMSGRVMLNVLVAPTVDPDDLAGELAGKNEADAQQFLATQLPLARSADISLSPGWLNRLPRFDWRIDVRVRPDPEMVETPPEESPPDEGGEADTEGATATATSEDEATATATDTTEQDEGE